MKSNAVNDIDPKADARIDLGEAGMGMPVIRSWQALKQMPAGSILHVTSAHP